MNFTKNDIHQIESKGLTVEQVKSQIEIFKTGVPYVNLSREATIDFGVLKISDKDKARHIKKFKNSTNIKNAKLDDLMTIKGINEKIAKKIISYKK